MLSNFSIKPINILISYFKCLMSDNSNITVVCESNSNACFISLNCTFSFYRPYNFLLKARHAVLGRKAISDSGEA